MYDLLAQLRLGSSFIPHGHCYLWKPGLVSLHLVSDALIAIAYYSIPVTLLYFVSNRRDLPFNRVFLLFAAFIVSCGTTHLAAIWTLWYPTYWFSGLLKALTALISVVTALELIPLVPLALALPSPAQLEEANHKLNGQIQERLQAEENLRQSQNLLEQRVQERTVELARTNRQLQQEILERQQSEAALRQSEEQLRLANERFELAVRAINALVYDWDVANDRVTRTEGLIHVLGFTLAEADPSGQWWRDRIHPEDWLRLQSSDPELYSRDYYQNEYRVLNKDNQYVYILDQGLVAQRQSDGRPSRIVGSTINISDRKQAEAERQQAEAALRQSEERFRALFEDAPDAIFIADLEGTYLDVNTSACRLLGYPAEALIGKRMADLVPQEDLPRLQDTQADLTRGKTRVAEWRLIDQRGMIVPVEMSSKMLPDGRWQAFVRDIRDRKAAEAAFQVSEAKLRSFVEANVIGILFCDIYGNIHDGNDELLKIIGYSREELESGQLRWDEVTPPEYLPFDAERIAEAQEKGACTPYEKEYIRPDGSRVPVMLGFSLLEPARTEAVTFIIDLSEQKRAEAERDRLLALEKAARAEAEQANRIKDEFLAVLSHELRSPLNPILGWATLLQRRQVDSETLSKALVTIERNIKLQLQLIDDLLDVSRILRGKLNLAMESVEMPLVVIAAIETVRLSAEAKSIAINTHLAAQGLVRGDAGRLQQIIWNLLSNAVKFTPAGGQIDVWLEPVADNIEVRIQDTGKGISPRFLPHVFEYFRQQDGSTTRQFGGLGLGLAIVRYLVEMHGGTVRADSAGEDQGATFTLSIPAAPLTAALPAAPAATPELALNCLQGVRILVVEDEADTRDFISFMLHQNGAAVTAVASAQAAVAQLEQALPDILLSDIGMPEMDGYMLISWLRSRSLEQGSRLPAVALTAYAAELDQKRAKAAGFDHHLPKPIDAEQLIALILKLVQPAEA